MDQNEKQKFDVVVIGGGPAGYVASIKLGQLGKKVVCIDDSPLLGGTCLNVGCIPSKALLNSSYKYYEAKNHFNSHGIEVSGVSVSVGKMMANKNKAVSELGNGIKGLFKKNKVEYINGRASFYKKDSTELEITINSDSKSDSKDSGVKDQIGKNKIYISAETVVIATGSKVISLPTVELDEEYIVSSTGALKLSEVPERMLVVGAGVIGLELGSVWSRLGAKVTIVEHGDRILPFTDPDVSKEVKKVLENQGITFMTNTKVSEIKYKNPDNKKSGLVVSYKTLNSKGEEETQTTETNVALISIGRRSNTDNLGLENIGIEVNRFGQIPINDDFATSMKGVYAIGDVVQGPMLAHKASEEGVAVAEIICGKPHYLNHHTIPNVIYTHPEIATVGDSEATLKERNIEYKIGKFPMLANSRARLNGETEGFVKILQCAKTETILGASIICANAGDMIHEIVVAMEFKATSDDIGSISHAHPTLSEATKEAALAAFDKPIHI